MRYNPGVRVMLGWVGTAKAPPATYASQATTALQAAICSFDKTDPQEGSQDWKNISHIFGFVPAADSGRVVVGINMERVPVVYTAPRRLHDDGAMASIHRLVRTGLHHTISVGLVGPPAVSALLRAIEVARASSPAIDAMGLELEDTVANPRLFLVSDDGRPGSLVWGVDRFSGGWTSPASKWQPSYKFQGEVRGWSHDYGEGESVRLIGVPLAEVGPERPIVRLPEKPERKAFERSASENVQALFPNPMHKVWQLRCDHKEQAPVLPEDTAPPEAATALPTAFTVRAFSVCEASAGSGSDHRELRQLDVAPSPAALKDAAQLLAAIGHSDAIGTWNANATGRFTSGDNWSVADLSLSQEQDEDGEDVAVLLALFAVAEGWAVAVWPASQHAQLAMVLGFDPWQSASWTECSFWYGE